jgi:hypothetical protein
MATAAIRKFQLRGVPTVKRNRNATKRYRMYYYHIVGDFTKQDTSGSTDSLERAYGHCASHCARSELNSGEYAQALVIDARQGRLVRSYKRDSNNNIIVKDF